MNKFIKDPRPSLILWTKFSIIFLITIPFLYFNIKYNKVNNLLIVFILFIVTYVLTKIFLRKENEENLLHDSIQVGYAFAIVWFFFLLIFLFGIVIDYLRNSLIPSGVTLLIIIILLFFSIILFHMSNRSRLYEKIKKKV